MISYYSLLGKAFALKLFVRMPMRVLRPCGYLPIGNNLARVPGQGIRTYVPSGKSREYVMRIFKCLIASCFLNK